MVSRNFLSSKRYFGEFGGSFVAETLVPLLIEIETAFEEFKNSKKLTGEFLAGLKNYAGRPTPLYFAENISRELGFHVYLKREDLLHTGAHKINNALGQAMLARFMGKRRVIAETGAGQHGVATATACAVLGMECRIFMGSVDIERQKPNVRRMELLGAEVVSVSSGSGTLKDAINEALRYWLKHARDTYYLIGSVVGPHPFPSVVRYFQSVIGDEARKQFLEERGRLPDAVVACVGGGSNAAGIFSGFIDDSSVRLIGVEAGGDGGKHCATLNHGSKGIFQGCLTYLLQDDYGNALETHSVAAGLDYPAVGPEHAFWKVSGRAEYVSVSDDEALEAFRWLSRLEGIIPALESAHALAYLKCLRDANDVIVCLSGRGDKDLEYFFRVTGS